MRDQPTCSYPAIVALRFHMLRMDSTLPLHRTCSLEKSGQFNMHCSVVPHFDVSVMCKVFVDVCDDSVSCVDLV